MTDSYQYGDINLAPAPAGTVSTRSFPLLVDATTTAIFPVYATLLTGTLISVLPASILAMAFTTSVFQTGAPAVNIAFNFRFRVEGVLPTASAGTAENEDTGRICSCAYSRNVPITQGLHTVAVEWTHFGGPLQTVGILAASLPDLFHANLTLEEQRA